MSKISYAIEIITDTTVTNATHGIVSGTFRWITGRPGYDGNPTYPKWEDTTNNTAVWYEGIIAKDGIGNPTRSVNIDVSGDYGTMSGFNLSIRNDTKFWEFCEANSIYLTNRQIKFYTVLDDIFYQTWDGVIKDTSRNETHYKITCVDKFKAIHKMIPPTLVTDASDNSTGEPIPVVMGEIPYSKLTIDTSLEIEYQTLWQAITGPGMSVSGTGEEYTRTAGRVATQIPLIDPSLSWYMLNAAPSPAYDPVSGGTTDIDAAYRALQENTIGSYTAITDLGTTGGTSLAAWVTDSYIDDTNVRQWDQTVYNDYNVHHDYVFTFWASCSDTGVAPMVRWDMYKERSATGTLGLTGAVAETGILKFSTNSVQIDSLTPKMYTGSYTVPWESYTGSQNVFTDSTELSTSRWRNSRVKTVAKLSYTGTTGYPTGTLYFDGAYPTSVLTPIPAERTSFIQLWSPGLAVQVENQFKGMYLFAIAGGGAQADTGYRVLWSSPTYDHLGLRMFFVQIDRYVEGFEESGGFYVPNTNVLGSIAAGATGIVDTTTIFRIGKVDKIGLVSESDVTAIKIDPATNLPYLYTWDDTTQSYLSVESSVINYDATKANEYGHPYIAVLPNKENIIPLVPTLNYITTFGSFTALEYYDSAAFATYDAYYGQTGIAMPTGVHTYGMPDNTLGDTFKNLTDLDKLTEMVLPPTPVPYNHLVVKFHFDVNSYVDIFESLSKLYFGMDAYIQGSQEPYVSLSPPLPDPLISWGVTRKVVVKDMYGLTMALDDNTFDSRAVSGPYGNLAFWSNGVPLSTTMANSREWQSMWQFLPDGYYLTGDSHGTKSSFSLASANWCKMPDDIFAFLKTGVCTSFVDVYVSFDVIQQGYWTTRANAGTKIALKQFGVLGSKKTTVQQEDLYARISGEKTGGVPVDSVYLTFKHILEDYDGISASNIDYTNMATSRGGWVTSRQITDRKSSFDYLTELARQSFTVLVPSRTGKRRLVAWRDYTANPVTHDSNTILRDSINGWGKSDLVDLHNQFKVNYSYDPGQGPLDTLYVDYIDSSAFLADGATAAGSVSGSVITWHDQVGGASWIGWTAAQTLWTTCHNSWLEAKVRTDILPEELSELEWYRDPTVYDASAITGVGVDQSAYKYLENLVAWTTTQKDKVNYSIPMSVTGLSLELAQPVTFSDPIYHFTGVGGWITSIEQDTQKDVFNIETTLEP